MQNDDVVIQAPRTRTLGKAAPTPCALSPCTSGFGGRAASALRRRITGFARAEDGVMLAFVMFTLLILMVVGGVGVDLMRTEMVRTKMQQTIDRAALAAAHRDNQLDPKGVVKDYFAKANLSSYLKDKDIKVEGTAGNRSVEVRANADVKTQFLGTLGFDTLPVPAAGRAEERMGDAEVSLVLDISGSMGRNNKMTRLHSAAKEFISTVITKETKDKVSLSVVPYTGDVNAGWRIFKNLNIRQLHSYSYCVQFDDEDFDTTAISTSQSYLHGQHFAHDDSYISYTSCPRRNKHEEILPFSQNNGALTSQVSGLSGRERTAIHIGMKWGVALLDPAFRPVVDQLIADKEVDGAFAGRPVDFGGTSIKTVVLMTDGENVNISRIKEFAYDTPDMRYHWARFPLTGFGYKIENSIESEFMYTHYTTARGDSLLNNICDAAKKNGIIVWTIGFEVSDRSAGVMEKCASSASHFYRVEGIQISEAFKSIARQLQQLRLTL